MQVRGQCTGRRVLPDALEDTSIEYDSSIAIDYESSTSPLLSQLVRVHVDLVGAKGVDLAEMTRVGLPAPRPPRFSTP